MPISSVSAPAHAVEGYSCNLAKVKLSTEGDSLNVRVAPRTNASASAHLSNGAMVYVCDATQSWYKVSFGGPSSSCGVAVADGLSETAAANCESGWVAKHFVEVLSG
jgi:hypothetical protein